MIALENEISDNYGIIFSLYCDEIYMSKTAGILSETLMSTLEMQMSQVWRNISKNCWEKGKYFSESSSVQSFSALVFLMFEARSFFVMGGCPMHWRMLSSTPGLHYLDARSQPLPPNSDNKCLQTLQKCLGVGVREFFLL